MHYKNINKDTIIFGWIGTGVMGNPMCEHLIDAGFSINLYTRTKKKAENLINKGAKWFNSPAQLAQESDIIFTMVGYPADIEEVYSGENGIFKGIKENTLLVDFTTTRPSLAKKIFDIAKANNCTSLDAPVSGGDIGARNATLSIMVGGEKESFDYILPVLKLLGKNIVYQGGPGSGQHTKMCNQITIAGTMIGVCEALIYGYKAGIDPRFY
jgi:3-hydroxyisobutyrate dehydrogenase